MMNFLLTMRKPLARHFADHGIGDLGLPSLRARLDQWMVANGFQYTRPVDRSVGYYCEQ